MASLANFLISCNNDIRQESRFKTNETASYEIITALQRTLYFLINLPIVNAPA